MNLDLEIGDTISILEVKAEIVSPVDLLNSFFKLQILFQKSYYDWQEIVRISPNH